MGLTEKRMLKTLQDEVVPEHEKELQKITGAKIKYDIDWDSFAPHLNAMERFRDVAFKAINESFTEVCRDEIGQKAVAESIKTIHLSQGGDSNMASGVTLQNGVLDIPWDWASWSGSFFVSSFTERLEALL